MSMNPNDFNNHNNFRNDVFRCPKCGSPIKGNSCTRCGYQLRNQPSDIKKRATSVLYVIVGIIMFIFVLKLIPIILGTSSNTPPTKAASIVNTESIEQYKASCEAYDYYEINTSPSVYKGKRISISGKIIQVVSGSAPYKLRIATDNQIWFTDIVYVTIKDNIPWDVLEDVYIIAYGEFTGTQTYRSILLTEITIPSVDVKYISKVSEKEVKEYYSKLSYANDCILTSPELPITLNKLSYFSEEIDSSLSINDISYKYSEPNNYLNIFSESNDDNKVNLKIFLSGTKTYDKEGETNSESFRIEYKIYDTEDNVVDSGITLTNSLSENDNFKDHEINIYNLEPQNYRIEFINSK